MGERSEQMASREDPAGSALQVTFESACLHFVHETDVAHQLPRSVAGGGRVLPRIVIAQAASEVRRGTNVVAARPREALEQIHLVHASRLPARPSSAEPTAGGLRVRCEAWFEVFFELACQP